MNTLPSKEDINDGTLDGDYAERNFYGKNIHEAAQLFFESSEYYAADFLGMKDKGFVFYFPSVEPYLLSDESDNDSECISLLLLVIDFKIKYRPAAIDEISDVILRILIYILNNLEKFDMLDELWGDCPGKIQNLIDRIKSRQCN